LLSAFNQAKIGLDLGFKSSKSFLKTLLTIDRKPDILKGFQGNKKCIIYLLLTKVFLLVSDKLI